jgi:hypothetical protein
VDDTPNLTKHNTNFCFWRGVLIVGSISSHYTYIMIFSKLFGLSMFRAYLTSVANIRILNYPWVTALIAYLCCLVAGIIKASSLNTGDI